MRCDVFSPSILTNVFSSLSGRPRSNLDFSDSLKFCLKRGNMKATGPWTLAWCIPWSALRWRVLLGADVDTSAACSACHLSWQTAIHWPPLPLRLHAPSAWSHSEGQTQGSPGNGLRTLWVGNLEPRVFREWSAGIGEGRSRFSTGMSSWSGMPHSGHGEWLAWSGGLHSVVILWSVGGLFWNYTLEWWITLELHSGITHGSGGFQREAQFWCECTPFSPQNAVGRALENTSCCSSVSANFWNPRVIGTNSGLCLKVTFFTPALKASPWNWP